MHVIFVMNNNSHRHGVAHVYWFQSAHTSQYLDQTNPSMNDDISNLFIENPLWLRLIQYWRLPTIRNAPILAKQKSTQFNTIVLIDI